MHEEVSRRQFMIAGSVWFGGHLASHVAFAQNVKPTTKAGRYSLIITAAEAMSAFTKRSLSSQ